MMFMCLFLLLILSSQSLLFFMIIINCSLCSVVVKETGSYSRNSTVWYYFAVKWADVYRLTDFGVTQMKNQDHLSRESHLVRHSSLSSSEEVSALHQPPWVWISWLTLTLPPHPTPLLFSFSFYPFSSFSNSLKVYMLNVIFFLYPQLLLLCFQHPLSRRSGPYQSGVHPLDGHGQT